MPYKSLAQAAFMHIHHPEVAKEFDKKSEHEPGELPEHVPNSPFAKKKEAKEEKVEHTSKLRKPKAKRGR